MHWWLQLLRLFFYRRTTNKTSATEAYHGLHDTRQRICMFFDSRILQACRAWRRIMGCSYDSAACQSFGIWTQTVAAFMSLAAIALHHLRAPTEIIVYTWRSAYFAWKMNVERGEETGSREESRGGRCSSHTPFSYTHIPYRS